ncbi:NAD(P)/FAD-dependent oxidoreductase [Novisyntrophococcus fermenticellae]|uniref:NAD(P)/FAD-dependent oxidoreductase n=1 Tax=Novisyntrophococcus fermenticellae TaxID=2068655 RepID=UPI001E403C09|nr:NAD(P)-binding protein [Novisyntrophococcus fermenticellae]
MIRITQLKLPVEHTALQLKEKIAKELRIPVEQVQSYEIVKRSVDARKLPITFVYQIDVKTSQEYKILSKGRHNNIMSSKPISYTYPEPGNCLLKVPPVIVGSGPAGLFCAYVLARQGYHPLILERGDEALTRKEKVDFFWKSGVLDPNSNVQFGEGGAGTFSDGKLNTLVKDPHGRNKEVLRIFVEAGAPASILYEQKPHLGTDLLIKILQNLRGRIEDMGGEFRFRSQMTNIRIEAGEVKALEINKKEWIPVQTLILAIGHSARDTFFMLNEKALIMEPKSFAVGVRIEHPQKMITKAQYGENPPGILGAANYKLTHKLSNGRGVYSFCMCPGGYVVNASSEKGRLAVNGMSYRNRSGENANSALIVTVTPEDYREYHQDGTSHILDGIAFQRRLEELAWQSCQGKIPLQLYNDFAKDQKSISLGDVHPCIKGEYELSNVRRILPPIIGDSLCEGIRAFGKKIPGFDRPDALISGVESRTSSPVRIVRDEEKESSVRGIYPCGEGTGYAGGITSAAMDGLVIAEAVCKKYMNC